MGKQAMDNKFQFEFLWVKSHRNIKNQGYHFNSKYRCSYDEQTRKMNVTKNEYFLDNLYGENLTSMTAIAGKNGAGKTTILNCIRECFASGNGGLQTEIILLYTYDNRLKCITTENGIDFSESSISLEPNILIKRGMVAGDKIGANYWTLPMEFHNISFCYFSQAFNGEPSGEVENDYDISTNHTLREVEGNKQLNIFESLIDNYRAYEIQEQVKFVNSDYKSLLEPEIVFPEDLFVSPAFPYGLEGFWYNGVNNLENIEHLKNAISNEHNRLFQTIQDNSLREVISLHFQAVVHQIIESIQYESGMFENIFEISLEAFTSVSEIQVSSKDNWDMWLSVYFEKFALNTRAVNIDILNTSKDHFLEKFKQSKDFLRTLWGPIEGCGRKLNIGYQLETASLTKFMTTYKNLCLHSGFLKFTWRGLSTGEQHLLNVFSRMYSFVDKLEKTGKINSHTDTGTNLVLLLDEPEIGLHPEWQRKLVYFLNLVTPKIFSSCNTVQIILTTNQPIILSDFPKYSVNYVSKEKIGYPESEYEEIKVIEVDESSFGASIHNLYKNSFFLKDSFTGEFFDQYLKDLCRITDIEVEDRLKAISDPEIKIRIELLGDDYIKRLLNSKLQSGFNVRN